MKVLRVLIGCGVVIVSMALFPPAGQAVEKCKVQVNSKTGAVEVSATKVVGNPSWGIGPGDTTELFADEADCFDPSRGSLKKCHLGAPGTLAEKTLPSTCRLCIGDDAGECCVPYIKSCSPGARTRDISFPSGDPRVGSGGILVGSPHSTFCMDSPDSTSCESDEFLCGLDLPELGGNEATGCDNEDDFRNLCCRALAFE